MYVSAYALKHTYVFVYVRMCVCMHERKVAKLSISCAKLLIKFCCRQIFCKGVTLAFHTGTLTLKKLFFAATLRRIRNFLDLQLCKSLRLRLSSAKHLDSILPR